MVKPVKNNQGKEVGFISDGTVLCKKVQKSKHFMKIYGAWAWDKQIFDEEFRDVKIWDTESDTMYISTKEDWLLHGIEKDFGHGMQIFLPVEFHEVKSKKQPTLQ